MANKPSNNSVVPGWGNGYVFDDRLYDQLVGRVLTIIETLGLRESQERATKDVLRTALAQIVEEGIYISQERHSEIREAYYKARAESSAKGLPMSAI